MKARALMFPLMRRQAYRRTEFICTELDKQTDIYNCKEELLLEVDR